jgi:hypothetical protein
MFNPDPISEFFPSRIPDANFFHPGYRIRIFPSRIPDPHQRTEVILPKKLFQSSRKYDPGCSSRIRILIFYPSRIPDPGVPNAPDPGSRYATLDPDTQRCILIHNTGPGSGSRRLIRIHNTTLLLTNESSLVDSRADIQADHYDESGVKKPRLM